MASRPNNGMSFTLHRKHFYPAPNTTTPAAFECFLILRPGVRGQNVYISFPSFCE